MILLDSAVGCKVAGVFEVRGIGKGKGGGCGQADTARPEWD